MLETNSEFGDAGGNGERHRKRARTEKSGRGAASSAVSATLNQNHKYDHVTAKVTSNKVLKPIAS